MANIIDELEDGDTVYAAIDFHNDGGIPDLPEDALLVKQGARGVIIRKGYVEEVPDQTIFLVRFEDESMTLGPPIGCWPEELRITPE